MIVLKNIRFAFILFRNFPGILVCFGAQVATVLFDPAKRNHSERNSQVRAILNFNCDKFVLWLWVLLFIVLPLFRHSQQRAVPVRLLCPLRPKFVITPWDEMNPLDIIWEPLLWLGCILPVSSFRIHSQNAKKQWNNGSYLTVQPHCWMELFIFRLFYKIKFENFFGLVLLLVPLDMEDLRCPLNFSRITKRFFLRIAIWWACFCIVVYCIVFLFLIPVFILTTWLVSLDKGCMCGNCHEQHLWKINDQQYENKKFWQLFCFQFTPRLSGPSKSSILNHVTTRRYCEYVAVCMP